MNETAEREWTAATTSFERVEAVLGRTTDWQSGSEIAGSPPASWLSTRP